MAQARSNFWKITLGINSRAATVQGNRLLYKELLEDARSSPISGGTVLHCIAGSHLGQFWGDVRSEIGSNELPVTITFIDSPHRFVPWLQRVSSMLHGKGIIAVEQLSFEFEPELRGFAEGVRLEVYTMESAKTGNTPLYQAVSESLRKEGAPWVSVARALCGFGSARSVHKGGWIWKREDVPIVVTALLPKELQETAVDRIRDILGSAGYIVAAPTYWYLP